MRKYIRVISKTLVGAGAGLTGGGISGMVLGWLIHVTLFSGGHPDALPWGFIVGIAIFIAGTVLGAVSGAVGGLAEGLSESKGIMTGVIAGIIGGFILSMVVNFGPLAFAMIISGAVGGASGGIVSRNKVSK
jgi:hypothetical protein